MRVEVEVEVKVEAEVEVEVEVENLLQITPLCKLRVTQCNSV